MADHSDPYLAVVPRRSPPGGAGDVTYRLDWRTRAHALVRVEAVSTQGKIDPWAGLDEPLVQRQSGAYAGEDRTWSATRRSQGLTVEVTASAPAGDTEAHEAIDALMLSIHAGLPATGFRFVNQGAGWAEAAVRFGQRVLTESASYLSDALGDPVRAALALLLGSDHEKFSWYDEPGSVTVELSRLHTAGDLVQVLCAVDASDTRTAGRQQVAPTSRSSLAWAIAHGARQQLDLHGAEEFERLWLRHRFPVDELDELESALPDVSVEPWFIPAGWRIRPEVGMPEPEAPSAAAASEGRRLWTADATALVALPLEARLEIRHMPPWRIEIDGATIDVMDPCGLVGGMLLAAEDVLAGVEVERGASVLAAEPLDVQNPQLTSVSLRLRSEGADQLRVGLVDGGTGEVLLDVSTPSLGFAVAVERLLHDLADARPEDPWGGAGYRPFPYDGWSRLHAGLDAAGLAPRRPPHRAPNDPHAPARILGFDAEEPVPPIVRRAVCLATPTEGLERDEAMLRLGRLLVATGDDGRARLAFEAVLTSAHEAPRCAAVLAVSSMLDDQTRVQTMLSGLLDASDRASAREAARRLVERRLADEALAADDPAVALLAAEDGAALAGMLIEANEKRPDGGVEPELLRAARLAVDAEVPHLGLALRAAAGLTRLRASGDADSLRRARALRLGLLRLRRGDREGSRRELAALATAGPGEEAYIAAALLALAPDAVNTW